MNRTLLLGTAVPFGTPVLIGQQAATGRPVLIRERFDARSFREIPRRIPVRNRHDVEAPLGWAKPAIGKDGLLVEIEVLNTTRGRDAEEEARSGARIGLSIGFVEDPDADEWTGGLSGPAALPTAGARREIPQVLRRNVELVEVSICSQPAYPTAGISRVVDRDEHRHEQSEAALQPWRADQAAAHARAEELKAWVRSETGRPVTAAQQRAERAELDEWLARELSNQEQLTIRAVELDEPAVDYEPMTELVEINGRSVRVSRPEYRNILFR